MGLHDHLSCLWLRKLLPPEHRRHERKQIVIFILGQQERLRIELQYCCVCLHEWNIFRALTERKQSHLKDQLLKVKYS